MSKELLNSINMGPIGTITLSNGQTLDIPKLTNLKLIKIAKFIGIDGMKLYEKFQNLVGDENLSDSEKFVEILSELDEKQIIRILAILLDISDEEALSLDPIETLEIIEVYVEKTNIAKAFTIVRNLIQKITGKEIPDMSNLVKKYFTEEETMTQTAG